KPRGEGDSRFVVFASAVDAVSAAADMQRHLAEVDWATPRPLLVRASLHTGTASLQLGDYYGSAVNRAARLRAVAHGGQVVISRSTMELVQDEMPPGVSVRDLGEHRLKDLTRPEHVYQVDIDGLRNDFPALASLGAVRNNLPVQLTEFVGRETELEEVRRIIGERRMLTILAPGGAGKTRLAIQTAAEVSGDFPDGVFFVDLAAISTPDDIVQTVAESIGIALSSSEDILSQLLAYLEHKTQLLIMDNFEHVSEGATVVSAILKGALDVKVIATSRSKLNIEGETVVPLGGLQTTWETEDEAFRTSSVELFVLAGKRADAAFTLSPDDLESLSRILKLVDGTPLAINLAGAWVDMLSIGEIASEITTTLDFLETEAGGVPDRHRSVRAVFDYSWKMLGEEERRLFAALSVFRGGFTREAAQELAGASLRALANLANKSLLTSDRTSNRYQVHELLRQYAEVDLQSDDARWNAITDAHTTFYAGVAGRVEDQIGEVEQADLFGAVDADIDNIRLAWRTAVDRDDADAMRRFVFGLFFHHGVRGWYRAGMGLLEEFFKSMPDTPENEVAAVVHAALTAERGRFLAMLGQPESTLELTGDALTRLTELPDRFAYLMASEAHLDGLAVADRWGEAEAVASSGFDMAEELGHEFWQAGMLTWWGAALVLQGHEEEGAAKIIEAADRMANMKDDYLTSWSLISRATIAGMGGRDLEARDLWYQVIKHSRSIGFAQVLQVGVQGAGDANLAILEYTEAERWFLEALLMAEDMGVITAMAFAMIKVAEVHAAMGRPTEAVEVLACVMADPVRTQRVQTQQGKIGEKASEILSNLEAELESDVYQAAYERGRSKNLAVAAKELLTTPGSI
ncbi:MAG: AAA family ATPase, partial [Acidimicrobiia bacterium]